MIVEFSDEDVAEMERLAEKRRAAVAHRGTGQLNRFRGSNIEVEVDGFKGEWAVADSLGLPREPNVSGRADDGADVVLPDGSGINVRFTPYRSGRLMCPVNRPLKSRWVVLVVGTRAPLAVRIVGGCSTVRFYERGMVKDFGYGATVFLEQDQLMPWARLAARYLP